MDLSLILGVLGGGSALSLLVIATVVCCLKRRGKLNEPDVEDVEKTEDPHMKTREHNHTKVSLTESQIPIYQSLNGSRKPSAPPCENPLYDVGVASGGYETYTRLDSSSMKDTKDTKNTNVSDTNLSTDITYAKPVKKTPKCVATPCGNAPNDNKEVPSVDGYLTMQTISGLIDNSRPNSYIKMDPNEGYINMASTDLQKPKDKEYLTMTDNYSDGYLHPVN